MSKTGSGDDFWGVKPTPATEKGVPNHEKIDFLGGSKAHQRQKGVPKTVQTRGGSRQSRNWGGPEKPWLKYLQSRLKIGKNRISWGWEGNRDPPRKSWKITKKSIKITKKSKKIEKKHRENNGKPRKWWKMTPKLGKKPCLKSTKTPYFRPCFSQGRK